MRLSVIAVNFRTDLHPAILHCRVVGASSEIEADIKFDIQPLVAQVTQDVTP